MDYDPALEVLLTCLRSDRAKLDSAQLAQVAPETWREVGAVAQQQVVAPLLYRQLGALDVTVSIPADVRQTLRQAYLHSVARNTRIYHELAHVLEQLRCENIPVIVLKGAYLAEKVYGDVAVRPMMDVDLLIRKADLDRGEAVLEARGYRSETLSKPFLENSGYDLPCRHPRSGQVIELHWHLTYSDRAAAINMDDLWGRARGVRIAGVETLALSPEDQIVYLGLHLLKHEFDASLLPFCDIAELLRQQGEHLQWDQIQQRAQDWQVQKALYLVLWLARHWLAAQVPDEVLDHLCPAETLAATRLAQEKILGSEVISGNFAQLWGKRPWPQKAAMLLKRLFVSPAFLATQYPAPAKSMRIYFYYLVRAGDLLGRYGQPAWRLWHGEENLKTQVSRRDALNQWLETP